MMLLERFAYTRYGTLGRLCLADETIYMVELPWRGNKVGRSCVPPGVYRTVRHKSPRFGDTYWLRDVPGRSEILIHVGNSPEDLDGCLSPGLDYGWWGERHELAVWNSRDALEALLKEGPEEMDFEIRNWRPEVV